MQKRPPRTIHFEITGADSSGRVSVEALHPDGSGNKIGHVVISPLDVDPDHYWWVSSPGIHDPDEIINSAWDDYGEERMLPEYWKYFNQSGAKSAWKVNSSYIDKNFRAIGLGKRLYEIMKAYVHEHKLGLLFPDNATDSTGSSTSLAAKRVWKTIGYDQPTASLKELLEPMQVPYTRSGWERNKPKQKRKKRTRQSNVYVDESLSSVFSSGIVNEQSEDTSGKTTEQQLRQIIREELYRLSI